MSFTRILVICCFFVFCCCEDKNSKKNAVPPIQETTQKPSIKETSGQKNIPTKENNIRAQKDSASFKLSDDTVVDFMTDYGQKNPEAVVRISTRLGNIDIQLYKQTPLHRANFIYLVKEKYFNETFFYRAAKDFVIQGGNSDRQQMATKRFEIGEYTLPQEHFKNLKHVRGSVALSKQWVDNPSNRSTPYEFFIVVAKNGAPHLDGEHTVFGKVIKGLHIADKISKVPVDQSEWPKENIFITAEVIR